MRCSVWLICGLLLLRSFFVTPVHADNRIVLVIGNDAAPARSALQKTAAQLPDSDQPDRAVALQTPPATSSEDLLLGRWRWIARCGSLGTYRGEFEIERISGDRFSGTMAESVSMTDGRIVRGERIAFVRKLSGGVTQHWEARLLRLGNGGPHLEGALRDSRFGKGTCPWAAAKD